MSIVRFTALTVHGTVDTVERNTCTCVSSVHRGGPPAVRAYMRPNASHDVRPSDSPSSFHAGASCGLDGGVRDCRGRDGSRTPGAVVGHAGGGSSSYWEPNVGRLRVFVASNRSSPPLVGLSSLFGLCDVEDSFGDWSTVIWEGRWIEGLGAVSGRTVTGKKIVEACVCLDTGNSREEMGMCPSL